MPNWCYTDAIVMTTNDDAELAKSICEKLSEWMHEPENDPKSGFGNGWLGNLLVNSGVVDSYELLAECDVQCRGEILDIVRDGSQVNVSMSTAWNPMLEPLCLALEKNFSKDSFNVIYSSEEPGLELYLTNDEDRIGRYIVEITDEASDAIKNVFYEECYYNENDYDEYDLKDMLEDAYGISADKECSLDELLKLADDEPGIYIHEWEFQDIADTF